MRAWLVHQGERRAPPSACADRLNILLVPTAACFPTAACSWGPLPSDLTWCAAPAEQAPPPALPAAARAAAGASAAPLPATPGALWPSPARRRAVLLLTTGLGSVAAGMRRATPALSCGTGAASGARRAYSASGSSQRSCPEQQAARQHRRPLDLLHFFRPIPVCFS